MRTDNQPTMKCQLLVETIRIPLFQSEVRWQKCNSWTLELPIWTQYKLRYYIRWQTTWLNISLAKQNYLFTRVGHLNVEIAINVAYADTRYNTACANGLWDESWNILADPVILILSKQLIIDISLVKWSSFTKSEHLNFGTINNNIDVNTSYNIVHTNRPAMLDISVIKWDVLSKSTNNTRQPAI